MLYTDPVFAVRGWFTTYTWIREDLGIQLTVETRDVNIYCDLVGLINGKIPTTDKYVLKKYDGFIEGRVAQTSLGDLLSRQLSISDPEIERIDDLSRILNVRHASDCDYRYISAFIIQYANLVKRYVAVFLQSPREILLVSARWSGR
jgi:hypothetical protein